jgi:hypothetical protein
MGEVQKVRVVYVGVPVGAAFGVRDFIMIVLGLDIAAVFAFTVWLHHQGIL